MDLMTAVMFLVGLVAGGGGAFFFSKKGTVVGTSTDLKPVASHTVNSDETDKLKKEINAITQKHTSEKNHLEDEISSLKSLEGQLKDQLSALSDAQRKSHNNGNNVTEELQNARNLITQKEKIILDLEGSERTLSNQLSELNRQLSNSKEDIQAHIQNSDNEGKKLSMALADRDHTINELKKKISELPAISSNSTATSSFKSIGERRLLVVDDSKVVRNKLSNTLKKAGYQVELAEDGRDALNKLQADNGFDLVVTDLEMPNLDGHELITAIHTDINLKAIPVMAITGHEEITVNVVHNEGLVGVHKKPWNDEELLKKISGLSTLKA